VPITNADNFLSLNDSVEGEIILKLKSLTVATYYSNLGTLLTNVDVFFNAGFDLREQ